MKTEDLILIGGAGLAAYLIYKTVAKPLSGVSDALSGAAGIAGGVIQSAGQVSKSLVQDPAVEFAKVGGDYLTDTAHDIQTIRDTIRNIGKTVVTGSKSIVSDVTDYTKSLVCDTTGYWCDQPTKIVTGQIPYIQNNQSKIIPAPEPITGKSLTASNPTTPVPSSGTSSSKSLISSGYDFSKDLKSSNPAVAANAKAMIAKQSKK